MEPKRSTHHLDLSHEQPGPRADIQIEHMEIALGRSGFRLSVDGAALGPTVTAGTLGAIALEAGMTGYPVVAASLLGLLLHGLVLLRLRSKPRRTHSNRRRTKV